jgi:hypothetical protein
MDFILPPDLRLAKATISLDANTAPFSSPTVGSTRTAERLGDRLRVNFDFTAHRDDTATARQRGRMQAFLSKLRGQASRVWMSPPGAKLRGSFPTSELIGNNTFAAGTSGWTNFTSGGVLSVSDRTGRVTIVDANQNFMGVTVFPTSGQYAPVVCRALANVGRCYTGTQGIFLQNQDATNGNAAAVAPTSAGLLSAVNAGYSAATKFILYVTVPAAASWIAGDYFDISYTSASQCALVDNAQNLLLNSDTPGTGTGWSVAAATAASNSSGSPDSTVSAYNLSETTANTNHYVFQAAAVTAAVQDCSFSVFLVAINRNWAWMYMREASGSTDAIAYFNISTGAVGVTSAGTNWTNVRATIQPYGSNWYKATITARKTNGATSITCYLGSATANGTNVFAGVTTPVAMLTWRAAFAAVSSPFQGAKTTSAAVAPVAQTGAGLNLRGLPVSTSGLLLPGDWVESNGQLNQVTNSLDSDASGTGYVQLARPFRNSPADGAAFIVNNPLGKFMVNANTTAWNEQPGGLSDATLEFVEDIAF